MLWLDAHTDFHTLETTDSGNLHGTPAAYFTGQPGFEGVFPPLAAPVDPKNVCMIGIRSVDPAERATIRNAGVTVHDMRAIDPQLRLKPPATQRPSRVPPSAAADDHAGGQHQAAAQHDLEGGAHERSFHIFVLDEGDRPELEEHDDNGDDRRGPEVRNKIG